MTTAQVEEDPTALYCSVCHRSLLIHWRGRPCLNGKAVMFFQLERDDDDGKRVDEKRV